MESISDKIIILIDVLAEEMKNGDHIIHQTNGPKLRWSWENARTGEVRFITLYEMRHIDRRTDLSFETLVTFVRGGRDALQTQKLLQKLPQLKAFL